MPFKVKVLDAILTHDTQIGSKMDPFCILKCGGEQHKTKILDEGGDMPTWNQQFVFKTNNKADKFKLTIYDEDMTVDDLVGQCSVDVGQILLKAKIPVKWYSLKYGPELKKPAGKIHLEFESIGGNFSQNQQGSQNLAYNNDINQVQQGYLTNTYTPPQQQLTRNDGLYSPIVMNNQNNQQNIYSQRNLVIPSQQSHLISTQRNYFPQQHQSQVMSSSQTGSISHPNIHHQQSQSHFVSTTARQVDTSTKVNFQHQQQYQQPVNNSINYVPPQRSNTFTQQPLNRSATTYPINQAPHQINTGKPVSVNVYTNLNNNVSRPVSQTPVNINGVSSSSGRLY